MTFQKRKKKRRKLDAIINLFLKTNMFSHFAMKRNAVYNILNKENLNEMMIRYFKIPRTYDRRKLFDCINQPNSGLNLSFDNPILIQSTSEEFDLNKMKRDVITNQVFTLKFLKDNSFEEMRRCNIRNVLIKDVKNKQQNLKKIPVIRNRTLKIYQDIWPFHHKAPEALRKMKVFSKLQGEMIPMTPLFDEMFNDFDNLHKQLSTKQKNDDFQGKKQSIFNLE
jgi:hypothetical protein